MRHLYKQPKEGSILQVVISCSVPWANPIKTTGLWLRPLAIQHKAFKQKNIKLVGCTKHTQQGFNTVLLVLRIPTRYIQILE